LGKEGIMMKKAIRVGREYCNDKESKRGEKKNR